MVKNLECPHCNEDISIKMDVCPYCKNEIHSITVKKYKEPLQTSYDYSEHAKRLSELYLPIIGILVGYFFSYLLQHTTPQNVFIEITAYVILGWSVLYGLVPITISQFMLVIIAYVVDIKNKREQLEFFKLIFLFVMLIVTIVFFMTWYDFLITGIITLIVFAIRLLFLLLQK